MRKGSGKGRSLIAMFPGRSQNILLYDACGVRDPSGKCSKVVVTLPTMTKGKKKKGKMC